MEHMVLVFRDFQGSTPDQIFSLASKSYSQGNDCGSPFLDTPQKGREMAIKVMSQKYPSQKLARVVTAVFFLGFESPRYKKRAEKSGTVAVAT